MLPDVNQSSLYDSPQLDTQCEEMLVLFYRAGGEVMHNKTSSTAMTLYDWGLIGTLEVDGRDTGRLALTRLGRRIAQKLYDGRGIKDEDIEEEPVSHGLGWGDLPTPDDDPLHPDEEDENGENPDE